MARYKTSYEKYLEKQNNPLGYKTDFEMYLEAVDTTSGFDPYLPYEPDDGRYGYRPNPYTFKTMERLQRAQNLVAQAFLADLFTRAITGKGLLGNLKDLLGMGSRNRR